MTSTTYYPSDVVHGVLQRWVDVAHACRGRGNHGRSVRTLKQASVVASCSRADNICIVSRRADAHGFRGTAIEIAHVMRELLKRICGFLAIISPEDLIQENCVVGRPCSACRHIWLAQTHGSLRETPEEYRTLTLH